MDETMGEHESMVRIYVLAGSLPTLKYYSNSETAVQHLK